MKLWLIARTDETGYDEYDRAVVAAESADVARSIHPSGDSVWDGATWIWHIGEIAISSSDWPAPDKVDVREVGDAAEGVTGVICASFNAG